MATEVLVSTASPSRMIATASSGSIESRRRRVDIGGVYLDQVDLAGALERIEEFVASGEPHQIVTVNLDFLTIARRDPAFRAVLNGANLAVADGMPLVWLSRVKGQPLGERVAGVELVHQSCQVASELGCSVFLLGAGPGVAALAASNLEALYPGLHIVGAYSPPVGELTPSEDRFIIEMIKEAAPDFLFVALGAPRQDVWIAQHQHDLGVPVAMGVGCVFDLIAGNVRRAPGWMQRTGLEWAFRLVQEPQRLWRRYLLDDLPTLAHLALGGAATEPGEALAV